MRKLLHNAVAVTGLLLLFAFVVVTVVFGARFIVGRKERTVFWHEVTSNAPHETELCDMFGCVRKNVMVCGPTPNVIVENLVFGYSFLGLQHWDWPRVCDCASVRSYNQMHRNMRFAILPDVSEIKMFRQWIESFLEIYSHQHTFGWSTAAIFPITDKRNIGGNLGTLGLRVYRPACLKNESSLDRFKRFSTNISGIFRRLSGFLEFWILPNDFAQLSAHHIKLTMVDAQSEDSDDSKSYVRPDYPFFSSPELSSKFVGFVFCIVGLPFAIVGQCALQWSGWDHWRWWRRLALGIGNWIIAIMVIGHGASLLLGIS